MKSFTYYQRGESGVLGPCYSIHSNNTSTNSKVHTLSERLIMHSILGNVNGMVDICRAGKPQ